MLIGLVIDVTGLKAGRVWILSKNLKINKTGTSKVGAISKAQKAQKIFFEKNLNFGIFFSQKIPHGAENVKGGPFGLY